MAELKAKIGLETNAFETGLARLQNKVGSFAKGIGGLVVGAFAFDKLLSAMTNAINKGDQLQDLANKFGISASQLQLMGNAAELSGASLESVAAALNKAAVNAQKAGQDKSLAAGFEKIGLSLSDLQRATPQDILMKFADAAASGAIRGQEFALAVQLMGRSATDLLPTFRLGSQEIIRIGQAMGIYTDNQIQALSAASDAIKTIGNAITLVFGRITAAIIPAAAAMAKFLGFNNLSGILSAKPPSALAPVNQDAVQPANQEEERIKRINSLRQRFLDIENRISESRLSEKALAEKLIRDHENLAKLRNEISKSTVPGAEEFVLEADLKLAAIRERLAGMGRGAAGGMQILTDSLQQVGGGGRFAQVGGGDSSVDYLKRLTDTNNKQLNALISIDRSVSGGAAGAGAQ